MPTNSGKEGRQRKRRPTATLATESQISDGKKKRKRKPAEVQDVSPEEQQRRDRQRQLRALAIQQRAAGREYRPPAKKRTASEQAQKPAKRQQVQQPEQQEQGSKPQGKVQVIVIPIFWNKRAEEKAGVLAVAEEVNAMLTEAGIASGVDTTTTLAPGQKFRSWEERKITAHETERKRLQVKLRVELGPADVHQGTCVLATAAATPGELASKTKHKRGLQLLKAIQKGLDMPESTQLPGGAATKSTKQSTVSGDAGASSTGKQVNKPQLGTVKATAQRSRPDGSHAPPKRPASKPKVAAKSGDDLEGDFQGLMDTEDPPEKGKKKKARKKHLL